MVERLMLLATDGQVDLTVVQMALPKSSPAGVSGQRGDWIRRTRGPRAVV